MKATLILYDYHILSTINPLFLKFPSEYTFIANTFISKDVTDINTVRSVNTHVLRKEERVETHMGIVCTSLAQVCKRSSNIIRRTLRHELLRRIHLRHDLTRRMSSQIRSATNTDNLIISSWLGYHINFYKCNFNQSCI